MIQINAIGNLGSDAEVKTINERQYISFRIASTEKRNGQDETTWLSVLSSYNENLLPFLKKGQQVFVSGRMKANIYQSNNTIGMDISVFANTLQLCGGKKEDGGTEVSAVTGDNAKVGYKEAQPETQLNPFPPVSPADDMPF